MGVPRRRVCSERGAQMSDKPKPGSPEAVAAGCTCPVIDNGHGRGYMGQRGVYVMDGDCPMHDTHQRDHDTDAARAIERRDLP